VGSCGGEIFRSGWGSRRVLQVEKGKLSFTLIAIKLKVSINI
jgi:hypothetical protein